MDFMRLFCCSINTGAQNDTFKAQRGCWERGGEFGLFILLFIGWYCLSRISKYYLTYLLGFLSGNSQLEYLTYQEVKRNKGIFYTICIHLGDDVAKMAEFRSWGLRADSHEPSRNSLKAHHLRLTEGSHLRCTALTVEERVTENRVCRWFSCTITAFVWSKY